jgi:hypothetical protein
MGRKDPLFRNIPHLLIFILAAETIRNTIDPTYKYDLFQHDPFKSIPKIVNSIASAWKEYISGQIQFESVLKIIENELKVN